MSFERSDTESQWAPFVSLAMIIAFFTIAYFLVRYMPVPVSAAPPAAEPSYQAADERVPSDATEARQESAEQPPRDSSSQRDPEHPSPSAREQMVFKSRRALETVDQVELLRRRVLPSSTISK